MKKSKYAEEQIAFQARRLKQLEEGNNRLKKLVVDLSLDKEMLQAVLRKSSEGGQKARTGRLAESRRTG